MHALPHLGVAMVSAEDQWKFALGSFIYEFAKLEAQVFGMCAHFIGADDTRKLTFGKRLDRIKAQLKQQSPTQCEVMLELLRQARGMSKFRNHLLHNTAFHGGSSPQMEDLQERLRQLEQLLAGWASAAEGCDGLQDLRRGDA